MDSRVPTLEPPRPDAEQPVSAGRRSRTLVVLTVLMVLVLAGIAAVIALVVSGIDNEPAPAPAPAAPADNAEAPEPEPDTPAPVIRYGEEPPANWDVTGVAADDRLNVRAAPGVHEPITHTLAPDTVELESSGRIARVDGALWREIKVPGATSGWVNARYLTETAPPPPVIRYGEEPPANWDVTGVAADDRLNVRAAPGVHEPITHTLAPDTVELESSGRIARVDGALWREIKVPGATSGWVNARYLTET